MCRIFLLECVNLISNCAVQQLLKSERLLQSNITYYECHLYYLTDKLIFLTESVSMKLVVLIGNKYFYFLQIMILKYILTLILISQTSA